MSSLPGISCAVPQCRTAITASQSAHELNTPFFMTLPAHLSQSPRPHSLLLGFSPFQFPSRLSFSGEIYCSSSVLPGSVPRHEGTAAQAIFQQPGTAILGWHTREGTVSAALVLQVLIRTKFLLLALLSVSGGVTVVSKYKEEGFKFPSLI